MRLGSKVSQGPAGTSPHLWHPAPTQPIQILLCDSFVCETQAPGGQGLSGNLGNPAPEAHLRSFWLMKPSLSFSTALASMELASLAKSRSRISDTGTDTMAKASLSSLVGHVPSCRDRGQQGTQGPAWAPAQPPAQPPSPDGPHTMSRMGRSSSTSMGTLVLWIHVLVQRCLSRTYEFLQAGGRTEQGECATERNPAVCPL